MADLGLWQFSATWKEAKKYNSKKIILILNLKKREREREKKGKQIFLILFSIIKKSFFNLLSAFKDYFRC